MEINNSVGIEESMVSTGNCSNTSHVQVGLDVVLLRHGSVLMAGGFLEHMALFRIVVPMSNRSNNIPVFFPGRSV